MKRIIYALSAMVLVIAGVAFTKSNNRFSSRYYFKYSANGRILSNAQPAYGDMDPYGCTMGTLNCSVVATSFIASGGVYFPAGATAVHTKPGMPR